MSRRILIAGLAHETNTFSKLPTGIEEFRRRAYHTGDAVRSAFLGTRSELGAFFAAAEIHGWALRHPLAAWAEPSGKVTAAAWRELSQIIVDAADETIDGVLLALHGAMVTETPDDAEGELLERLRARLRPEVPIAITLDLHANVSDRMARHANIIIAYRTYPHIDQHERGLQAATLLERAMAGEIRPRAVVARRPMLIGLDAGRTTSPGPMTEMLARADALEREPGILAISVQAGFGWSDIPDAGPSIVVVGEGEDAKYRDIAESLMDEAWRTRTQSTATLYSVAEAIEVAETPERSGKPLILADFTDNPGGGAYGDATNLLAGMLGAQLANGAFGPITDPAAVRECAAAGLGARLSLEIGGKIDPSLGPPLKVIGTVRHLGDGDVTFDGPMWQGMRMSMGDCAVLRVAGIDILLASNRFQIIDLQQFLSVGIDPRRKAVVGLKSSQHFRAAYQPIARKVLIVDAGGLLSTDFRRFPYKKLRRPIWPLDEVVL